MIVHIYNSQRDLSLQGKKETIIQIVQSVVTLENVHPAEVTLHFVTDSKMRKMHKQFFQDDSPTDCMSFPLDTTHLGEVVICPKTAIEYAAKHKKNPFDELTLYIIHGLLHLIGYDDLEERMRKKMRAAEKKHIKALYLKKIRLK